MNDRIYAIGGCLTLQVPATTLFLTLEYTPPLTPLAPLLTIRLTATNSVMVAWPAPSTGFELEQTSNLNAPDWSTHATPPTTVGGENQVIVPPMVGNQFYRLKKP